MDKSSERELQFLLYCDEKLFVNVTKKLSDEYGEIHLVYTGCISSNSEEKYIYFIPLARTMAKQQLHLHIYPSNLSGVKNRDANIYREYYELDKKEKYFHFHKPVPYKELSKEIAKYDWGLWIHPEGVTYRTCPEKRKVSMGNKLFSYLEAGLPIIVSSHRAYG